MRAFVSKVGLPVMAFETEMSFNSRLRCMMLFIKCLFALAIGEVQSAAIVLVGAVYLHFSFTNAYPGIVSDYSHALHMERIQ
jgi:hypothetical protein